MLWSKEGRQWCFKQGICVLVELLGTQRELMFWATNTIFKGICLLRRKYIKSTLLIPVLKILWKPDIGSRGSSVNPKNKAWLTDTFVIVSRWRAACCPFKNKQKTPSCLPKAETKATAVRKIKKQTNKKLNLCQSYSHFFCKVYQMGDFRILSKKLLLPMC